MHPTPVLVGLLALSALGPALASAQHPVVYQDVSAEETEPLDDERGVPRTPRLELAPSVSYGTMTIGSASGELLGVGGRVALLVPMGARFLVGAQAVHQRRTLVGANLVAFDDDADFGSQTDLGLLARGRLISGSFELGVGVAGGASRFGSDLGNEWGYFVNPHVALRTGAIVAFHLEVGLVHRGFSESEATELGFQASLGLSFLLWSYR